MTNQIFLRYCLAPEGEALMLNTSDAFALGHSVLVPLLHRGLHVSFVSQCGQAADQ